MTNATPKTLGETFREALAAMPMPAPARAPARAPKHDRLLLGFDAREIEMLRRAAKRLGVEPTEVLRRALLEFAKAHLRPGKP